MHIYLITNMANGKMYVGQTVQDVYKYFAYNKRCAVNHTNYKPALYSAIRKYGPQSFDIRVIHTANSKEELDQAEKAYIQLFGTNKRHLGYNLTDGGDGTIGAERTKEWRQNISKGLTGKRWTPERSAAASLCRKGRILSEEHKSNIGRGVKGTKKPPQWIDKLRARNKARKGVKKNLTPEQKAEKSRKKKEWWAMKKQEVANAA